MLAVWTHGEGPLQQRGQWVQQPEAGVWLVGDGLVRRWDAEVARGREVCVNGVGVLETFVKVLAFTE